MRPPEDWAMNEWRGKIQTFQDAIIFVAKVQADALGVPFDASTLKIDVPEHLRAQLDKYACEDCGCSREKNKKCINASCKSNAVVVEGTKCIACNITWKSGVSCVNQQCPNIAAPLAQPTSTKNTQGEDNKRSPAYDGIKDKLWFGKHRGVELDNVSPDYLAWLFSTGVQNEKLRNYIWNSRNAINADLRQGSDHKITRYIMPV